MNFLKRFAFCVFVLALCAAFAMPAMAQDQSSARGNLSGLVYDSSQSLVPGAEVTITGPIGSQTENTNGQGSFLFSTLIPGIYTVKVTKAGFKVSQVGNLEVLINKTTSLSVTLEPGAVTQVVEVASASMTVDTTASSVNTDLSNTFYENIPVARNVASLFYLAPGVVSGLATGNSNPAISGSSGLENLYVADGVSINDPAFGGLGVWSRSYGALGSGINLSFVKEVQVKTGGFEPQYGHVSGGIVQIVTKSGGTSFHGGVAGYFNTNIMQDTYLNADDPRYSVQNLTGRHIQDNRYEASAEMGGYVPLFGLKDRLFWFGNYNPTWNQADWAPALGSGLFDIYGDNLQYRTFSGDYAAKLTFKINNSHTIESSVFGDPNLRNYAPSPNLLNAENTTVNSKWNYGTRNWDTRYDGALSPTWTVDAAFTWSWNHFTESPQNVTQIVDSSQIGDGQRGTFTAQGFGFFEPYDSNTKSIQLDTAKTFHYAGQHTFSVGYNWQYPVYNDITRESGPKYAIPETNASGGDPGYQDSPGVVGSLSDASLTLLTTADAGAAAVNCTLCPYETVPDGSGGTITQRVVLQQVRGRFDGGTTASSGKYHAAYANDSWAIGTHVTLNMGVRWEQQRLTGNVVEKTFVNMWSPRIGIIIDPKGDRRTKIYANYGRYAFVLPLDAAVRSLSSEADFLNPYFQPASTSVGCPGGLTPCVITDGAGNPDYANLFVPDSAHLLNLASGGINLSPSIAISGGEPFAPGTRMEYTDEWVVGAEHQFRGGIVASARYIDRRLKRVIEDQGGISVEQFNALAANGGGLNYFIGNPNSKQDIFVNPQEQTFGPNGLCSGSKDGLASNCGTVDETQIPCATVGGAIRGAFDCALRTAINNPNAANAAALEAFGFPSTCIQSGTNMPTPFVAPNTANTFGTVLGSACYPAVDGGATPWLIPNPGSATRLNKANTAIDFGGEFHPDGIPDTYKDPKREYEAVEFEVNKSFSHNWAMVANWRIAQLRGNYEGAFRNDNGQADPGISSLFDLTEGSFGLIGQQQGIGPLNTDRRNVVNVYTTYVLSNGMFKGMVLGGGLKLQTGVPLTTLAAQQAYQNPGEVPIFGRGDLGRAPLTASIDAHIEYPWKINDRFTLKFGFDAFNIADGRRQTLVNQNVDQGFGLPNSDFQKPFLNYFQLPFQSRGIIKLEF